MADLLAIHRLAVRARLLDERLSQLARAGRIGFHPDARGLEPALAAAVLALRAEDAIFPSARDHIAHLARGTTMQSYAAHVLGTASDPMHGHAAPGHLASRAARIGSPSGIVGAHLTHAVGYAWASVLRLREPGSAQQGSEKVAVLATFGETASGAGDFHSSVNFAGATKAPVIFFCRTDRVERPPVPTPTETVAEKAIGYGIEATTCSADDPESVSDAIAKALERALDGEGPTLVEAIRTRPDPLDDLRARLIERGAWDRTRDLELRRETMTEIESALTAAQQEGPLGRDALFDDVFATLPSHLLDQKNEPAR